MIKPVIIRNNNFNCSEIEAFEGFVKNHPNGNFFQSGVFYRILSKVENHEACLVLALDESGNINGALLGDLIKQGKGLKGYATSRCIVTGGPLVLNNDHIIAGQLIAGLGELTKRRAIYTQFRNLTDLSALKPAFDQLGYEYEEHLNFNIDLTQSEDGIWKQIHSKRRNEIRRAEREGTAVRLALDPKELETSYDILREVYSRAKLPLPERLYFEQVSRIAPDSLRVFVAVNGGRVIGTLYALCYNRTIFDWYAGSFSSAYDKYPNDILPWRVFCWGRENGYRTFDFGGAGKPGVPYGVREYKKKYGGETINFGRFQKTHNLFLYHTAKTALNIYRRIKL